MNVLSKAFASVSKELEIEQDQYYCHHLCLDGGAGVGVKRCWSEFRGQEGMMRDAGRSRGCGQVSICAAYEHYAGATHWFVDFSRQHTNRVDSPDFIKVKHTHAQTLYRLLWSSSLSLFAMTLMLLQKGKGE